MNNINIDISQKLAPSIHGQKPPKTPIKPGLSHTNSCNLCPVSRCCAYTQNFGNETRFFPTYSGPRRGRPVHFQSLIASGKCSLQLVRAIRTNCVTIYLYAISRTWP
jgi:hypothetical protein